VLCFKSTQAENRAYYFTESGSLAAALCLAAFIKSSLEALKK